MIFIAAFEKVAVEELQESARLEAMAPMQSAVPGTELRSKAETAQARGRATRTGVMNEDKQFGSKYHTKWRNSRLP